MLWVNIQLKPFQGIDSSQNQFADQNTVWRVCYVFLPVQYVSGCVCSLLAAAAAMEEEKKHVENFMLVK